MSFLQSSKYAIRFNCSSPWKTENQEAPAGTETDLRFCWEVNCASVSGQEKKIIYPALTSPKFLYKFSSEQKNTNQAVAFLKPVATGGKMSYQMKRYEDLDITDNFMFAKVFSNEDVAKDFLQDILKISIDKISVVAEATTQEDPFHKSVRFDVLVKEELPGAGRYFDIELQMEDTGELPKRARYYQGMCDLDVLAKGVSYDELREQYILFICPDDIFGKDKAVYRFQNREESDPSILMGDLCYKNYWASLQSGCGSEMPK